MCEPSPRTPGPGSGSPPQSSQAGLHVELRRPTVPATLEVDELQCCAACARCLKSLVAWTCLQLLRLDVPANSGLSDNSRSMPEGLKTDEARQTHHPPKLKYKIDLHYFSDPNVVWEGGLFRLLSSLRPVRNHEGRCAANPGNLHAMPEDFSSLECSRKS